MWYVFAGLTLFIGLCFYSANRIKSRDNFKIYVASLLDIEFSNFPKAQEWLKKLGYAEQLAIHHKVKIEDLDVYDALRVKERLATCYIQYRAYTHDQLQKAMKDHLRNLLDEGDITDLTTDGTNITATVHKKEEDGQEHTV